MNIGIFYIVMVIVVVMSLGAVISKIVEVMKENRDPHLLCLTIVDRSGRTIGTRNVSPQEAEQILHASPPPSSSLEAS